MVLRDQGGGLRLWEGMRPRHPSDHLSSRYSLSGMLPHSLGVMFFVAARTSRSMRINIEEIAGRMVSGDTDIAGTGVVMDAVAGDDPPAQEPPF